MYEIDLVVEDPDTIPDRIADLRKLEERGLGRLAIAVLSRNEEDAMILRRGLARTRGTIARLERGLALRDGPTAGTA